MIAAGYAFAPLRAALEHAGVRYAIGGSWASTAFGEPRFTNDLDILADFTLKDLDRFQQELDRAVFLANSGLSEAPAPFVTQEDILLAKLHWFMAGGQRAGRTYCGIKDFGNNTRWRRAARSRAVSGKSSEVQWRDIQGIVRNCGGTLDRNTWNTAPDRLLSSPCWKRRSAKSKPSAPPPHTSPPALRRRRRPPPPSRTPSPSP